MKPGDTTVRFVSADEASFTYEAGCIQMAAERCVARVVALGPVIFFSTTGGDAWVIDPNEHSAACLARDGVSLPVPIQETKTKQNIEWHADFRIDGDGFTIVDRQDGASRTNPDYPVGEIERMAREYPTAPLHDSSPSEAARARLKTGRNEPCPCGSGKKYKKCCLRPDEDAVRRSADDRQSRDIRRAETLLSVNEEDDDEPEYIDDDPEKEIESGDSGDTDLPPEVLAKADGLWDEFRALKEPAPAQMDALMAGLLVLPAEATEWDGLLHEFADLGHPDLPGVFRRITAAVPHTRAARLGYLYWAAVEEFAQRGMKDMLPEVAEGYCRLDLASYDADALHHSLDLLIAAGCDTEALMLAEHFLPILRVDKGLMSYTVPETCDLIFELRVGRVMKALPPDRESPDQLARRLRLEIDSEIDPEAARVAAEIVTGEVPLQSWTRAHFDLGGGDISSEGNSWRDHLRFSGMLMRVAKESWQLEKRSPGCTIYGASLLLNSLDNWRRPKSKRAVKNLLECLSPQGLEKRIVRSCPEIIGVNRAQVCILIQTLGVLTRSAVRHDLIAVPDAAAMERELSRLEAAVNSHK